MDNFKPIDVDFLINHEEVKTNTQKVKDDIKSVGQTAEQTAAKVNKQIAGAFDGASAIKSTNKALANQAQIINKTKPQWNGLGHSINQITRELPSFALSAQTGFLAISNNIPMLADQISMLSAENKKLAASGEKTVPVWKQVTKGFFSWGTALSAGVVLLTVYGKEFVTFLGNLLKGKNTFDELKESVNAVNKAFEGNSYRKAIKDMQELRSYINLAKDGIIDKDVALKKYNDTLGEVYKDTNDLNEAERVLIEKAPAYIEAMLYKAAAMETASEAAKKIAENEKKIFDINENLVGAKKEEELFSGLSGFEGLSNTSFGTTTTNPKTAAEERVTGLENSLNNVKKETDEIEAKSSKVIDNLNKKAAEIAKKAGINIFGLEKDDPTKAVSEYQKLLDKIEVLDKEYARKSFTKDQEEQQALTDKFARIRTLVKRYNEKPENKAKIIDLAQLDEIEKKATESLIYRQSTDKLKEEIEAQKKVFEDFETYKKQFGISAAKEEFKDKLANAESYYDYLQQLQKANASAYEAVEAGTATGGQAERVQFLNSELKKAGDKRKKLFNEQLADLLSYEKKRKKIIENYQAERKKLIDAGKTEEAAELDKQHQEELDNLDDKQVKKLQSYKELYEGIRNLTAKETKIVLENAKKMLETQKMSAELKVKILKQIAEIEQMLSEDKYNNIFKYASVIGELGDAIKNLGDSVNNSSLSNAGALLSGLASSAGEIVTIFKELDGGSFSDLSNAGKANVVAAGVSGVINMIGMFASAAQKRKEAEEEYYLAVIGFQNQYNLSLQEQVRLRSILDENVFLKDYEGRIKDALSSLHSANEEYQIALQNLIDRGKVKTGLRNAVDWGNVGIGASSGAAVGAAVGSVVPVIGTAIVGVAGAVVGAIGGALVGAIGGLFGGKKKKNQYTAILNEYPELIKESENGVRRLNIEMAKNLVAHNLVNKATKQMLEDLIAQEEQLEESRKQIKEVINELAGSLGSDLKNLLVDAFVSGEDAAVKMGDTVEKVLENILSSLIFNAIFDEAFTKLEEQMAQSFDIGGDGTWVDDFARFFNSATDLTDDFNEAMRAAQAEAANFGFEVFKPETSANNSLTGAIRRELTEATGSELSGLFRGYYDLTKQLVTMTEAYYAEERKNYASVLELISINTKIEQNTALTVNQLELSLVQLKKIAKYTQDHYILDGGN